MPKKPFWAHLPQVYKLGPSPHVRLNFQKKILSGVDHKILNKMRSCLGKSDKWLPSYAEKTILGSFAPYAQTRSQFPFQTKFSKTKILSSGDHKILNKIRGSL